MQSIGYTHIDPIDIYYAEPFDKRQFLYFDKVYFHDLSKIGSAFWMTKGGSRFEEQLYAKQKEIELLKNIGLLEEVDAESIRKKAEFLNEDDHNTYSNFIIKASNTFQTIKDIVTKGTDNWFNSANDGFRLATELIAHSQSLVIRKTEEVNCLPIIKKDKNYINDHFPTKKRDFISVFIKSIPTISDETRWEQIKDFKDNPDTRSKYLAFRNWLSDISKMDISEIELKEKMEYLLNEYSKHLELHKLKNKVGTLELIITTTAEVLENLVKLNFSTATKKIFELKKQNLALIEAELSMPGREVAYVDKIERTFT